MMAGCTHCDGNTWDHAFMEHWTHRREDDLFNARQPELGSDLAEELSPLKPLRDRNSHLPVMCMMVACGGGQRSPQITDSYTPLRFGILDKAKYQPRCLLHQGGADLIIGTHRI